MDPLRTRRAHPGRGRPRALGPRRWRAALVAAAVLAGAPAAAAQAEDPADEPLRALFQDEGPRLFAIPATREARALAEAARKHAAAGRHRETLDALQRLIELHPRDVLPASWSEEGDRSSQFDVHSGAGHWAANRLRELPPPARELYLQRYGDAARVAFEGALANGDRRGLVAVAQRWPITRAAELAWWTLGDIELELGHYEEARSCWSRAAGVRALGGGDDDPLRARLERAERAGAISLDGRETHEGPSELRLPGPGEGGGPIPPQDADTWSFPLAADSPVAHFDRGERHPLFPVVSGDRLVLTDTLRVWCVDAHSGEAVWSTDPPRGWERFPPAERSEFYRGVNGDALLSAPAISDGIAVAALQVPHALRRNADFQGITIMVVIPQRRLFAFELETGRPLWDHAPPAWWDGASGDFATRMQVAGPPVVAGSLLVVPSYRLEGRVDFQVGCYRLETGELVWSTPLVSGQRPLNMFGRHEKEFCAPPARVEGDRVIVMSQLGTIACLDLYTGEILWESTYDQIELPQNRGWRSQERDEYWRNTPPVVADGLVIATPADSPDLLGIDLETGDTLWSYFRDTIGPRNERATFNALLGASRDTIYLGGFQVNALGKPSGLRSSEPFQSRWALPYEIDASRADLHELPRPVLTESSIVVPTLGGLTVVDRRTGFPRPEQELALQRSQTGNVCVAGGVLFTLGPGALNAFFDWDDLLERSRARLAEDPGDRRATLSLARLLERRGSTRRREGAARLALDDLVAAVELLEPMLSGPAGARDRKIAERLHHVLRETARARAGLAESGEAVELLDRALALASGPEEVRATLLEKEVLLRNPRRDAWFDVMDELERRCGDMPLPAAHVKGDPGSALAPLGAEPFDARGDGLDLPIGLWVLFERARAHGSRGEVEAQLEDLHEILARHADHPLSNVRSAGELASAEIERALERHGRGPYARFEGWAAERLERGLEERSSAILESVTRLWPQSRAAERARATRLEWAFEAGETEVVARLVLESLSDRPEPTVEDARLLLRLAAMLRDAGNRALERGLLRSLAEHQAELASELPEHEGRTIRELAARLPAAAALPSPSERASFDATVSVRSRHPGDFALLGELAIDEPRPESPARTRLVFAHDRSVVSIVADDEPRIEWEHALPDEVDVAELRRSSRIAPGRAILALEVRDEVRAIDTEDGSLAWRFRLDGHSLEEIEVASGVVVVLLERPHRYYRAVALDAQRGIELWSVPVDVGSPPATAVAGDDLVAFLPGWTTAPVARAQVFDLFRGVELRSIPFDEVAEVKSQGIDAAWIEDGLLVLPRFLEPRKPGTVDLLGLDLARGTIAWSVELGDAMELESIARAEGRTYLFARPVRGDGSQTGAVLLLDPHLGATQPVLTLSATAEPIGVERLATTELSSPYLFVNAGGEGDRHLPIQVKPLPYGEPWVFRLQVAYDELWGQELPEPAVSRSTVALCYTAGRAGSAAPGPTTIELFDRRTWTRLDARVLPPDLSQAQEIELSALGGSLIVAGRGRGRPGRLELWSRRPTPETETAPGPEGAGESIEKGSRRE